MVETLERFDYIQRKIAGQIDTSKNVCIDRVKNIAGFDCAFFDDKIVCAAIVFDARTLKVIERKYCVSKISIPYIPGFLAFREGPAIIQVYYDIENEPDVLILDGHGVAHQNKCGLACYVGLELNKPSIGVAKNLVIGEVKDNKIIVDNEERGAILKTNEYANALFVSPGHLIDIKSSVQIVQKFIFPPHKLPEPLHEAHKFAKKSVIKLNGGKDIVDDNDCYEESEQERIEREFRVNSGNIV